MCLVKLVYLVYLDTLVKQLRDMLRVVRYLLMVGFFVGEPLH